MLTNQAMKKRLPRALNAPVVSKWVYFTKGLQPPVKRLVMAECLAVTLNKETGALASAARCGVAVASGSNSVAWVPGSKGIARADDTGTAITGNEGISWVEDGVASSGDEGIAIVQDSGTATVGKSGLAKGSKVATGDYGIGIIRSSDIESPSGAVGNRSILVSQYRFGGARIETGDNCIAFCYTQDVVCVGVDCMLVVRFDDGSQPRVWTSFEGGALVADTWYQIDVSGTPVQCPVPSL